MAADEDAYALLARLVRTQGRHGELIADILTDFPERFAERREVWLLPPEVKAGVTASPAQVASRPAVLERHWLHKGRIVLKFAGVDSISDATALAGWRVAIPREARAPLSDETVYISDLIGCRVVDEAAGGSELGVVADVERGEPGAADLLVIRNTDGSNKEPVLIPFAKVYLVDMNLAQKLLRMRLPAGLAAIDAPLTDEERARQASERDDDAL